MKHIYLNLKRFDIPREKGGVNSIADPKEWGSFIVKNTQEQLKAFKDTEFAMFFPEAHLIPACSAKTEDSPIEVGTQGLFWGDTKVGGPFGAFTTSLTGNAAVSFGCSYALIGHCEERNKLAAILGEAGVVDTKAVNRILNKEILAAKMHIHDELGHCLLATTKAITEDSLAENADVLRESWSSTMSWVS